MVNEELQEERCKKRSRGKSARHYRSYQVPTEEKKTNSTRVERSKQNGAKCHPRSELLHEPQSTETELFKPSLLSTDDLQGIIPFDPSGSEINIHSLGLVKPDAVHSKVLTDINTPVSSDPDIRNLYYFEQSINAAYLETRAYPLKKEVPFPPSISIPPSLDHYINLIQTKERLCSETILQAMKLLRASDVLNSGFLCTELLKTLDYTVLADEFLQIIHGEPGHWVVVRFDTTIERNTVFLYDPIYDNCGGTNRQPCQNSIITTQGIHGMVSTTAKNRQLWTHLNCYYD